MVSSPVDEIKARLDIADVIRGYIKLEKAGANLKAVCPFHSEKTPSFFVSPARQTWHCFGCDSGGDIFTFIEKIEGVEFVDALRILAERAGVTLKREESGAQSERKLLLDIHEKANAFFCQQLQKSESGKRAFEYLSGRGLTPQTIDKFQIGYAPKAPVGLLQYLLRNYKIAAIDRTGLVVRGRDGFSDRFRGRIMFPLNDSQGRTVGFSGRLFDSDDSGIPQAKYINTPQTPLYDKSRILYGLDQAKIAIRKKDACVLVEGQMDLLMSHQAGIAHTVATSGTALTEDHLRLLKRYTGKLLIAFDMDSAGDAAAQRGILRATRDGFDVRVVMMPETKDPADVIQEDVEMWRKNLEDARSIMDFHIDAAFSKYSPLEVEGKKLIVQRVAAPLATISSAVEKTHYIRLLAKRLMVREDDIRIEVEKIGVRESGVPLEKKSADEPAGAPASPGKKSRDQLLEERLLVLLGVHEKMREKYPVSPDLFSEEVYREIASFFSVKEAGKGREISQPARARLDELTFIYEAESNLRGAESNERDAEEECAFVYRELNRLRLQQKLQELSVEIREAECKGETKKLPELAHRFRVVSEALVEVLR